MFNILKRKNKFFMSAKKEADAQKEAEKKAIRKRKTEETISAVMEKTGWSREYALAQMKDAKARLGITYKNYNRYDFYKIPVEEQEMEYQFVLEKIERRKQRTIENEELIRTVMEKTGWKYESAKENMEVAKTSCGAEYKDYVNYKFWELDEETWKTFLTKGCRDTLRKKYNTSQGNIRCFMNKCRFNEIFGEYLGRAWVYNRELSLKQFMDQFQNEKKLIYKPLSARCGEGIQVFELNADNLETVYSKIWELPPGIVEGYLVQHHEMSKYSKRAVNTIRVISIFSGGQVHMLYAAFRMGGGDAVVDNFHNGGISALIDLESGEVYSDAIDLQGNIYEIHPDTGVKMKGFVIPYWDEAKKLIDHVAKIVDGVGYVGWDIAITEHGPVLIEGNTAPAADLLQMQYYVRNHKGVRYLFEDYL